MEGKGKYENIVSISQCTQSSARVSCTPKNECDTGKEPSVQIPYVSAYVTIYVVRHLPSLNSPRNKHHSDQSIENGDATLF